jgi:hypothetical protein
MDFGFAPGKDKTGALEKARDFLRRNRPQTTLVERRGIVTVERFIDFLENEPGLARPIDDIVIVSHGNDQGLLSIDLDIEPRRDAQGRRVRRVSHTDPEELIAADASDSVDVPAALTNANATFFIRGCRIGRDTRFLELFRTALGGRLPVNAPQFFYNLYIVGGVGAFEWFSHDFALIVVPPPPPPRVVPTRDEVIAAFSAAGFTFADGFTPIPGNSWDGWIPTRRRFNARRLEPPMRVTLGQVVAGR